VAVKRRLCKYAVSEALLLTQAKLLGEAMKRERS